MGNCLALCKPSSESGVASVLVKQARIVSVAKLDGKILEFSSPVFVKDVLPNFPALGISESKEASEHLSPDYELKAGGLYYLLPSLFSPPVGNREEGSGVKRVKLVITKQQLELLVAKQISIEDILYRSAADLPPSNWKPKLVAIPEETEWHPVLYPF